MPSNLGRASDPLIRYPQAHTTSRSGPATRPSPAHGPPAPRTRARRRGRSRPRSPGGRPHLGQVGPGQPSAVGQHRPAAADHSSSVIPDSAARHRPGGRPRPRVIRAPHRRRARPPWRGDVAVPAVLAQQRAAAPHRQMRRLVRQRRIGGEQNSSRAVSAVHRSAQQLGCPAGDRRRPRSFATHVHALEPARTTAAPRPSARSRHAPRDHRRQQQHRRRRPPQQPAVPAHTRPPPPPNSLPHPPPPPPRAGFAADCGHADLAGPARERAGARHRAAAGFEVADQPAAAAGRAGRRPVAPDRPPARPRHRC